MLDASAFRAPEAGAIVRTMHGYDAFVPAPLPPSIAYDPALVLALSRADTALSELSGLGRYLPNPHLLIAPYIRREAVLSSRIEGTRASLSDVLLDEVRQSAADSSDDIREVRNYVTALEYGVRRLTDLPLSLRLVQELHARLMQDVRGNTATPGEFRRRQNWIGRPGSSLVTADYVPPPPEEVMQALYLWEGFLHAPRSMPDLVLCALLHEQFEAIHPFWDGNGRLGRLLIPLFLIERGRLSQPLLYLSAYFERRRSAYYHLLQRVRTDGDWPGWIRFFLEGVAVTADAARLQAAALMDLRARFDGNLRPYPKARTVLDALFANPYITVNRAASVLQSSAPTARSAIEFLRQHGVLEEITGRAYGRTYCATPILHALEASGDADQDGGPTVM